MITAILVGIIIGYILAMPPGPVGITAIRLSLSHGSKTGTFLALGTGLMDFVFCLATIFTSSAALKAFNFLSDEYPLIMIIIQVLIIAALVTYGIISLRGKNKEKLNTQDVLEKKHIRFIENLMRKGPFLLGIAIALTNIPNPTFLPSIALVTTQVHGFGLIENLAFNNVLFAFGFGAGNFLWLYTIVKIISKYKRRMSESTLIRIRQFAGLSLIGVGTLLGYRLVTLTHWQDVLKFVFAI